LGGGVLVSADSQCVHGSMHAYNKASKVLGMMKRMIKYKECRIMLTSQDGLAAHRILL